MRTILVKLTHRQLLHHQYLVCQRTDLHLLNTTWKQTILIKKLDRHQPIKPAKNLNKTVIVSSCMTQKLLIVITRKTKMYQQHQQNYSKSSMRPASNFNQLNDQYSTVVTVQPPPPIAAPPSSHQRIIFWQITKLITLHYRSWMQIIMYHHLLLFQMVELLNFRETVFKNRAGSKIERFYFFFVMCRTFYDFIYFRADRRWPYLCPNFMRYRDYMYFLMKIQKKYKKVIISRFNMVDFWACPVFKNSIS